MTEAITRPRLSEEKEKKLAVIAEKFLELNIENINTVAQFAELMLVAQNTAVRAV